MTGRSAALISIVALAGCAAPGYQRLTGSSGYEDFPKDATTYVVAYKGSADTSRERVAMYLHYRCAELTVEAGQRYFTVLTTESRDQTEQVNTPGYATSTVTGTPYGRTPYGSAQRTTTYTPSQTMTYVMPGISATIRLSSGEKPEGAYDAREVMQLLGPRIGVAAPTARQPAERRQ